jgi:hypothetical protein
MQPSNFDELTKALAATRSRRHALRLIVTTSVGGLLGLTSISTVFGRRGPKCHRNGLGCDRASDCCSGYCSPKGKCACVPAGGNCSVNTCCSGICRNGTCCDSGETCPDGITCCIPHGGGCSGAETDCCAGQLCCGGVCRLPADVGCQEDNDCCTVNCVNGVCL